MERTEQGGLELVPREEENFRQLVARGDVFLRAAHAAAASSGDKFCDDIAAAARVDPSQLGRALAVPTRPPGATGVPSHPNHFCVRCHLPFVLDRDRGRSFAQEIARFHGGLWVPEPELDDDEAHRAVREELRARGLENVYEAAIARAKATKRRDAP